MKPPTRSAVAGLVASLLLVTPQQARAQSRTVPLGGKTATMGMAATAAGSDSAMPYLNPAGLGNLSTDVLALSASVYAVQTWQANGLLGPEGLDPRAGRATVVSSDKGNRSVYQLPSSVMYVKHLDSGEVHHVLGMALVIPQVGRDRFSATDTSTLSPVRGAQTRSTSVAQDQTSYYLGPTYALKLGGLRLGASAFLNYQTFSINADYTSALSQRGGTRFSSSALHLRDDDEALNLVAIAGMQAQLGGGLSLGAAAALPGVHLGGNALGVFSFEQGGNGVSSKSNSDRSGSHRNTPPLRLNAGLAYEKARSFGVAVDVYFHGGRKGARRFHYASQQTEQLAGDVTRSYTRNEDYEYDVEGVFDVSIGAEAFLSDWLSVRAGAFTDRTNRGALDTLTTRNDPSADPWTQRISSWGATLGLGLLLGPVDTTVGAVYRRSTGDIVVVETTSQRVADEHLGAIFPQTGISSHTLLFVLSGAVATSEAKKTIVDTLPTPRSLPDPKGILP